MRRTIAIGLGMGLVFCAEALAWGPATHVYLVMQITELKDPDMIC